MSKRKVVKRRSVGEKRLDTERHLRIPIEDWRVLRHEARGAETTGGAERMSDRENPPEDLFDCVCRLDDLAEWLEADYPDEAKQIYDASMALKSCISITAKPLK